MHRIIINIDEKEWKEIKSKLDMKDVAEILNTKYQNREIIIE